MKWNKYPETTPEVNGLYVVRFAEKVRGYSYGYRFYDAICGGEQKFHIGNKDSTITYWGSIEEFSESRTTLPRPSDDTLVQGYFDKYTGDEIAEQFGEEFEDKDLSDADKKELLLARFGEGGKVAIAEDEWYDYCFEKDCEREDQLWESGSYF